MGMAFPPGTGGNRLGFSLGAVGGKRGTGAGVARQVLIDFITHYDKGQLEKLAQDLQKLQADSIANQQKVTNGEERLAQLQKLTNTAKEARNKLDAVGQGLLQQINDQQTKIRSEAQTYGRVQAGTRQTMEQLQVALAGHLKISRDQLTVLLNEGNIRRQLASTAQQQAIAQQEQLALDQKINVVEAERAGIVQKSMSAFSGIKGLLLGAVGGIIGGAIIGAALFTPLQGALDAITSWANDIIDPARHAREGLKEVADQVSAIASKDNLSSLAAAQKLIAGLGGLGGPAGVQAGPLASLTRTEALKTQLDEIDKLLTEGKSAEQLWNEQRNRGLDILLRQLPIYVKVREEVAQAAFDANQVVPPLGQLVAYMTEALSKGVSIYGLSTDEMRAFVAAATTASSELDGAANSADGLAAHMQAAADAAEALRQSLLQTSITDIGTSITTSLTDALNNMIDTARTNTDAAITSITDGANAQIAAVQAGSNAAINALQSQMSALKLIPSSRTKGLEAAIAALSSAGPSARTKALADQIDRINKSTERLAYLANLAAIAQQRHDLVLAHSLSLQETQINVLKYHGQDRITAIDAELARLQKRNQAQQTFNQLLDIEYQYQQGVKRTVGESVTEFIQRRAQFYRGLINQTATISQQSATDTLNKQKADAEYEVKLRALTEQRKQVIADRARKLFLARLQLDLQASQAADQAALAARRKALEAELAASKAADQAALDSKRKAIQAQIDAIKAGTASEIKAIQDQRDAAIKAAQASRDATIAAAKAANDAVIKAAQQQNKDLLNIANNQWTDQRILALQGAKSLAELELFAGQLGGSNYALGLLIGQIKGLGLPPDQAAILLANATRTRAQYLSDLARLTAAQNHHWGGQIPGLVEGGVFPLTNAMNFGNNMRVGEQGKEIGVVLSNKVVEALRHNDQGRKPLFGGDMIIQSTGDPYRDRALWRREVRDVIRDELRH